MAELKVTILGCGSSGGVPRLGGHWGNCDPENPKNHRRRCSALVERIEGGKVTRVLIDTTPDLRSQLLDADIGLLDGVVYTHMHADHIHGIDDLRMVVFNRKQRLSVWADPVTAAELEQRFAYVFTQPKGSNYPPILELNHLNGPVEVAGEGGVLRFEPFPVEHGSITAYGYRIGPVAYLPDVSEMTPEAWSAVEGLECWILDALQYKPHPTHVHLDKSLSWLERAGPRKGVLTNMHIPLDYETVLAETPDNVTPAYDGMILDFVI